MPTPEQIQMMQRKITEDAQKAGMSVPQYLEHMKCQAKQQQRAKTSGGGAGGPGGSGAPPPGAKPIHPGPPKPEALAVAKFLRSQELKLRTVILNGERKDMFRGETHILLPKAGQVNRSCTNWNFLRLAK